MKTKRALKKGERRVGGQISGGVGSRSVGAIYRVKRPGHGRGKYERTEYDRRRTSKRNKGKECAVYRFTEDDHIRQGRIIRAMGKAVNKKGLSKSEKALVGSIPDLKKAMNGVYLRKLGELKKSDIRGVEEIARMEALVEVGTGVMSLLLEKWQETDLLAKSSTDEEKIKMFNKFLDRCFNKWGFVNEELRKTIGAVHEMKYGKQVTVTKKGEFETELDKLQVVDVTPEKIDDGSGKEEPNKSV